MSFEIEKNVDLSFTTMERLYKQLTQEQRYQLDCLLRVNTPKDKIAELLQCHLSTVYREIKRKSKRGSKRDTYDPEFAQHLCKKRHELKTKSTRFSDRMKRIIRWLIRAKWSPEQIVMTCKKRKIPMISIETV